MLRLAIAAIGVTTAFILAPSAAADMCDNHGVGPGQIYKTACGATSGTGGGGPMRHYVDSNGKHHNVTADEYRDILKENRP